jgi:hypothetical protein
VSNLNWLKSMKEVILEVLNQLDKIQYVDTSEHLYDAVKCIKRHLDDDNLDYYIDDFLWGLESPMVIDFNDEIEKLCKFIRENRVVYRREIKLNKLGI